MPLPPGETIRWEGGPDWRSLARHAFHARKIAGYFGVLLGWRAAASFAEADPLNFFLAGAVPLALLGSLGVASAIVLAWLTSRSSRYAITDRRVVMRIGIVVSSVINVPFRQIRAASAKRYRDGTGDLALDVGGETRIPYFHLWPHARPWRLRRPEPAFRSLPAPDQVSLEFQRAIASIGDADPTPAPAPTDPARLVEGLGPVRPQLVSFP